MDDNELGAMLARAVFSCGDEGDHKVNRIAFKGGNWATNTETDLGGLCEEALASVLSKALTKHGAFASPKSSKP